MSKRANPTVIGAFVAGAVALGVSAVLVFGGGELFRAKQEYVLYFEGSIKGLQVGAPVRFRGVKVGTVTDVRVVVDTESFEVAIPVIVEIDPRSVTRLGEDRAPRRLRIDQAIERGLRAQLQLQSLLTGQLFIQLDFYSDKPARFVASNGDIPELPTIPTPIQEIERKFSDFPIEEMLTKFQSTAEGIDRLVNAPETMQAIRSLNATLKQATATLATAESAIADESQLRYELSRTMAELSAAARSVRLLADELERRPDALLRGKARTGGQ